MKLIDCYGTCTLLDYWMVAIMICTTVVMGFVIWIIYQVIKNAYTDSDEKIYRTLG